MTELVEMTDEQIQNELHLIRNSTLEIDDEKAFHEYHQNLIAEAKRRGLCDDIYIETIEDYPEWWEEEKTITVNKFQHNGRIFETEYRLKEIKNDNCTISRLILKDENKIEKSEQ